MKRWYTTVLALAVFAVLGSSGAWAQHLMFRTGPSTHGGAPNYPLIFDFESVEDDTLFWGHYGFTPENEADNNWVMADSYAGLGGTAQHGADAIWMDWSLYTPNDWGGSAALQHYLPTETLEAGIYYDFSDFTHINMWYNALSPADPPLNFRFKVNEASNGSTPPFEDWYSESPAMYSAAPGWLLVSVPLEDLGNNGCCGSAGFHRPGWSGVEGNNKFDLDKIAGFQLEWSSPVVVGDLTTEGVVAWDNFHVSGVRYNTVESFDAGVNAHWKNSNAGSYTLTTVTDDPAEGTGNIKVGYNIVGDQGWGGSVDIQIMPTGADFGPMEARTALSLFYRVLTPASLPNAQLTVKLFDREGGVNEEWDLEVRGQLNDTSGKWRRLLIPFDGPFHHETWMGAANDGVLNRNTIVKAMLQLYVPEGSTSTGVVEFDRYTGYGFQETDNQAPAAVTGFSVSQGDFQNIVSWTDLAGEEGENYTVYASESPITDVSAVGVAVVGTSAEGVEAMVHPLFYPVSNNSLTYYYAIVATDRVGNIGPATVRGTGVPNNAKGIVTVALATPTGFAADGALGDWAGVTPIHMEVGTLFGHSAGSIVPGNAADLSANVYLAMDNDALYFAFDVTDDIYDPVPDSETGDKWMYDGGEFYIGLYDGRLGEHAAYLNAAEPDYKLYMYKQDLRSDQITNPVALNGDGMYFFGPRGGGWVTEGKVLFSTMKKADFPQFVPMNGMRIPLDVVIMDDDTAPGGRNRESILTYSAENNDNSWQSPRNWFYTWIGDEYATGVEAISTEIPSEYALHQNYPNPFNPTTTFRYDVKETGRVSLKIFNILGQEVETLVNADQTAGQYEVHFDASQLTSGVYVYQLRSGNFVQSRKMLLVR